MGIPDPLLAFHFLEPMDKFDPRANTIDSADRTMDAFNVEVLAGCISDTVPTPGKTARANELHTDVAAVTTRNLDVNTHGKSCLICDGKKVFAR